MNGIATHSGAERRRANFFRGTECETLTLADQAAQRAEQNVLALPPEGEDA